MHVLNVAYTLDLAAGSGTAQRTRQLSRHLARKGVKCTILTLAIGHQPPVEGVRLVQVPCFSRRYFLPRPSASLARSVDRLVREADIVHVMGHWSILNAMAATFARRYGKPYLVCPAGTMSQEGRSLWLKRLYNITVGRRLIGGAQGWIAVTPGEFPAFARYGVDPDRLTVVPNGIDVPQESAGATSGPYSTLRPYVLYVGRLHEVKGPDLLLEAFVTIARRFPDHRLVFIGPDDGMRAGLEERARGILGGTKVVFLGYRGAEEVREAYRQADLVVIPSRSEAMSLVVLEAAATGAPVMVTDRCGFDEIAHVDPRLLVPATAGAIAGSACSLLGDRDGLARAGIALKEYVLRRYDWDNVVERFIDLCRSILTTDPNAAARLHRHR